MALKGHVVEYTYCSCSAAGRAGEGDPDPVVAALDADVALFDVRTQSAQVSLATRQERVFAYLVSAFAGLALLLACIGIYGTLAYSVARRTPEIGLRMALGAGRARVVRLVLRESAVPVLAGVGLGLAAGLAATRPLAALLFRLEPHDAPTLVGAALLLMACALLAARLPSYRASRVEPMTALRCDG